MECTVGLSFQTLLSLRCRHPLDSIKRRRLLDSMKRSGVRLVCYASSPAPGLEAFVWADDWILGPPDNFEAALAAVQAWQAAAPRGGRRIDHVMSYDEYGVQLGSRLAEAFGAPPCAASPPWAVEVGQEG